MTNKAEVGYNKYQAEGKPWYVSDGQNNKDSYIRDDLTEHGFMMNGGGTYFETKEEAQALCDVYNFYTEEENTEMGALRFKVGDTVVVKTNDGVIKTYFGDISENGVVTEAPSTYYPHIPGTKYEIQIGYYSQTVHEDDLELVTQEGDTEEDTQEITVGTTYQCINNQTFTCIYIEGDKAWMRQSENSPAYIWNKNTGEAISLGVDEGYNLKRSFVTVE